MPRRFRAPRNLDEAVDAVRKVPAYARLVWGLARDPRVPAEQKLVLGAIAAYLVFPIDVIPDFIPVIGELDDIAVVLLGLDWFIRNAPPEVVEDHMTRIARHEDTLSRDLETAGTALADRTAQLRATLERLRKQQGGDSR